MSQFLLQKLREAFLKELPGEKEHLKMTPYRRLVKTIPENPKKGAVLLLIYPKSGEWFFPLTQRHDYKGVHGNQISFPGGKVEKNDDSNYETALRETQEEIGIDSSQIIPVGEMTEIYIPPSNFLVSSFIGFCDEEPNFIKEKKEVKEIIEVPILDLFEPSVVGETQVKVQGGLKLNTPFLDLNSKVVWGATAAILAEFRAMMIADKEVFKI